MKGETVAAGDEEGVDFRFWTFGVWAGNVDLYFFPKMLMSTSACNQNSSLLQNLALSGGFLRLFLYGQKHHRDFSSTGDLY